MIEGPADVASVGSSAFQGGARTGGDGGISTENIDLELLGVFALEIRFDTAAKTALPR